ncbi:hypothetical protein OIO90_000692 [Microbotryomycetes sp. JL221]|nr:hypothetical protein OIO90_000692 [Microbotryomycetes sp. JL221]
MSWRNPSTQPAPTVTSFSPDPAFGGSSHPTHRPSRTTTSTTNSAAATSLSRHISDSMMDDGASIRSGRSVATISYGSRAAAARQRAGSSASTIAEAGRRRRVTSPDAESLTTQEDSASTRRSSSVSTSDYSGDQHESQDSTDPAAFKRQRAESSSRNIKRKPSLPSSTQQPESNHSGARSDSRYLAPPPSNGGRGASPRSSDLDPLTPQRKFSRSSHADGTTSPASSRSTTNSPAPSLVSSKSPRANQLALQKASARIVSSSSTSASSTGWLTKVSKPAGTDEYREAKDRNGSLPGDETARGAEEEEDGRGALAATPRPDHSPEYALTPKPSQQNLASANAITPSRSSWFGWGGGQPRGSASTEPDVDSSNSHQGTDQHDTSSISAIPQSSDPKDAPATQRTWFGWRSQPTQQSEASSLSAPVADEQSEVSSEAAPVSADASAGKQRQEPVPISSPNEQALRSKPSRGLLERFGLMSSSVASSSSSQMSVSPIASLPKSLTAGASSVHSSKASTMSRASTDNGSAPNSPFLTAQQDGQIKPLTGTVNSNQPRSMAHEPDPPFENLVLPTFTDTFERPPRSFPPQKSKLTRAVSAMSAYFFQQLPPSSATELKRPKEDPAARLPKALNVVDEAPRLDRTKRVVTIGVHGWFPTPKVKFLLGEPTGTSVKFASMMHDAVQTYLESKDVSSFNIQAIALEGHGQIEERVNKLYDQLISRDEWVQALKMADVVFLATHSQGSVVSAQLLARMLDQGLISYTLSPYFNYLESAPARELFEFQNAESMQARKFLESMRIILSAGIKMTVVGSINDQVVPLYSALFSGISHPGILRAVYIDSQAFRTSDFLANLVVFSARLRNAGLKDHDLLYHVSEALAGALTGVGHSKIYDEEEVFALRGLIEDSAIRELFDEELHALREAYETWRPATKALKEVKLKLEGIRMLPRPKDGKL